MNWENLRFFVAIARAGTLSGAAKALDVDQATVSRRLMSLEAELGLKLIERLPREARLTEPGRIILAEAIDKLTEKEQKVIALYYFEELTLKEISNVLEVSESRVSQ